MVIRRTTVAAEADDLAVLDREARRKGLSLSQVLREAVAHEAAAVRGRHRPHFGIVQREVSLPEGAASLAEYAGEHPEAPAQAGNPWSPGQWGDPNEGDKPNQGG